MRLGKRKRRQILGYSYLNCLIDINLTVKGDENTDIPETDDVKGYHGYQSFAYFEVKL